MAPDRVGWTPERFYAEHEPPSGYEGHLRQVHAFVERQSSRRCNVVLVTVRDELTQSGGTTVPLERNV